MFTDTFTADLDVTDAPAHAYHATGLSDDVLNAASDAEDYERWLAEADAELAADRQRCACCGREASPIVIVGTPLNLCDTCLMAATCGLVGFARVKAYLAREDMSPVYCPCGRRMRDVPDLAGHLLRAHGVTGGEAARAVVAAIRAEQTAA